MSRRVLGTLVLFGALTLSGCGGGGGGGDVSSRTSGTGSSTPSTPVSAALKTATAATADTSSSVLQQVETAEEALVSGDGALGGGMMGGVPRLDVGAAALGDVFTSRGRSVLEFQAPTLGSPTGVERVTMYDAQLVAGANFTDSDANGRVSSQAEKDSITAKRLTERTVRFSLDFLAATMTADETLRVYGATTVDRFSTRSYTNALTFSDLPTAGMRPESIETAGTSTAWIDAAAEAASQAVLQGGTPDATTAERATRYHSRWDFAARTSVSDFAGVRKVAVGRWKLDLGRNTGTVTRTAEGASATHQGTAKAWERSSAFDLANEVIFGAGGFSFTATGADTLVSDVRLDFTSTGTSTGQRVLQGTVRDDVKAMTFEFTVQDGQLTGTIYADSPAGPVALATVTLDRHGDGQIVYADGTVVLIRNFRPQQG